MEDDEAAWKEIGEIAGGTPSTSRHIELNSGQRSLSRLLSVAAGGATVVKETVGRLGAPGSIGAARNAPRISSDYAAIVAEDTDDDEREDDVLRAAQLQYVRQRKKSWLPESNLDVFFTSMYSYYYQRGFGVILAKHLTNLITLAFTITFSTTLLVFVDWTKLLLCRDSSSQCLPLDEYLSFNSVLSSPSPVQAVILAYFCVFSLYWLWSFLSLFPTVISAWGMRRFFVTNLDIPTRELQTMDWQDVVRRFDTFLRRTGDSSLIAQLYMDTHTQTVDAPSPGSEGKSTDSDAPPPAPVPAPVPSPTSVSPHVIAMRIMRRDNYLISMLNKEVFSLAVQLPILGKATLPFTKSFEWNFQFVVLNWMFSDKFTIRNQFTQDPRTLRRRFMLFGLLNVILMPFILPFMAIYFAFKHAEEFQTKKDYLGPRKWSLEALWRMREFNELPHVFERRMNGSYQPAALYQKQFPAPLASVLARCVSYLSGAVLSALLLLTLIDENMVLYIKIADRNLLWYIAVFSAALALSRSLIPEPEDAVFDAEGAMRLLVGYTHFFPKRWRGRSTTYDVRDELLSMFKFRVVMFFQEILGVLLSPYILMVLMPRQAVGIVEFVKKITLNVPELGAVCGYSLFDLKKYGNRKYGGPVHASKDIRSRQGKMEKSLISFHANHPEWASGSEAAKLISGLKRFQDEQTGGGTSPQESSPTMLEYGAPTGTIGPLQLRQLRTRAGVGTSIQIPGGARSGWESPLPRLASSVMSLPAATSLQSLAVPLGASRYMRQENYFYWLDRYYDAHATLEQV